ncbi:hypothetical protein V5799_002573 [Amblyomma americanum]|uniref:Uncharacterized protein n=1 Tax=Amblyomma americanum TaxID=6943 RepID=A0AAQ4CWY7_AMBAM
MITKYWHHCIDALDGCEDSCTRSHSNSLYKLALVFGVQSAVFCKLCAAVLETVCSHQTVLSPQQEALLADTGRTLCIAILYPVDDHEIPCTTASMHGDGCEDSCTRTTETPFTAGSVFGVQSTVFCKLCAAVLETVCSHQTVLSPQQEAPSSGYRKNSPAIANSVVLSMITKYWHHCIDALDGCEDSCTRSHSNSLYSWHCLWCSKDSILQTLRRCPGDGLPHQTVRSPQQEAPSSGYRKNSLP